MSGITTMKDVAKACGGIHPSTVSLALRDSPAISAATRKLVRMTARKLGYRPDPLLGAFNRRRVEEQQRRGVEVIAYIAGTTAIGHDSSVASRALWKAGNIAAEMLHCRLEQFVVGKGGLRSERLATILRARGIKSYVVVTDEVVLDPDDWSSFWGVRINNHQRAFPPCIVTSDHRNSARMAVRRLRNDGFQRIGLALDVVSNVDCADFWSAGYLVEEGAPENRSKFPILELSARTSEKRRVRSWIQVHGIQVVLTTESTRLLYFNSGGGTASPPVISLDLESADGGTGGCFPDYRRLAESAVGQVVGMARSNDTVGPTDVSCTYVTTRWHGSWPAPSLSPSEATTDVTRPGKP